MVIVWMCVSCVFGEQILHISINKGRKSKKANQIQWKRSKSGEKGYTKKHAFYPRLHHFH